MNSNNGHIISSLKWDTLFDQKDGATMLQNRLSSWSKIYMPNEIISIFNKVCPPEQTWKIQSLQLNLGTIDLNNLEFELTIRLRRQLQEQLVDLIVNSNKNDRNIEIFNETTSPIAMLSVFLLQGVMPWNYRSEHGTVDQMLANQLKINHQQVIDLIIDTGATHQNVRKRIAWQINEPNILEIIKGLEPGNHRQIINFSNELITIQAKETIVQTSSRDFKKNLWLWVLNYLLVEHGTVFNKVVFMKSSIKQMSAHYNISYDKLLDLIEHTVEQINKRFNIDADFIFTLKTLLKERTSLEFKNKVIAENNAIDYWHILESYFNGTPAQAGILKNIRLNDLIIWLSKNDETRFRSLLIANPKKLWSGVINEFDVVSLEVVCSVLNTVGSVNLSHTIKFLNKLIREINLKAEQKISWKIGIEFLLSYKDTFYNNKDFIDYYIAALGVKLGITKKDLLSRLVTVKVPSSIKTGENLDLYSSITAIYVAESTADSTFVTNHFNELTNILCEQLITRTISKSECISIQKSLVKNIYLNPAKAINALAAYQHKDKLLTLIPYLTDNHTSQLLVESSTGEISSVISAIQRIWLEFKRDTKAAIILGEVVDENLVGLGLRTIIFHPEFKPSQFLEYLLKELFAVASPSQSIQLALFVNKLSTDSKLKSYGILMAIGKTVYGKYIKAAQSIGETSSDKKSIVNNKSFPYISSIGYEQTVSLKTSEQRQGKRSINNSSTDNITRLIAANIGNQKYALTQGFINGEWHFTIENLDQLLNMSIYSKVRVGKILIENLNDTSFVEFRASTGNSNIRLLNYLLPDGESLMQSLVANYTHILKRELTQFSRSKITLRLNEIYWQCILDYTSHKGDNKVLKRYFEAAILFDFPIADKGEIFKRIESFNKANHSSTTQEKYYQLKNGDKLFQHELYLLIEECLTLGAEVTHRHQKKYYLSELFLIGLESDPQKIRKIIANIQQTEKRVEVLTASISFTNFTSLITNGTNSDINQTIAAIQSLYEIVQHIVPGKIADELLKLYWEQLYKLITTNSVNSIDLNKLVKDSFYLIVKETHTNAGLIIEELKRNNIWLPPILTKALVLNVPAFSGHLLDELTRDPDKKLLKAEQKALLDELVWQLIIQKQIPVWFGASGERELKDLLNKIIVYHPLKLLHILKNEIIAEQQMVWLSQSINFKELSIAIGVLNRPQQSLLAILEQFHIALGNVSFGCVSAREFQSILFRKVLKAWASNNWKIISTANIWNELIWEVCVKRGVSKKAFLQHLAKLKLQFPLSLQISLGYLISEPIVAPNNIKYSKQVEQLLKKKESAATNVSIQVNNAGLVLLNSYIPILFDRLGFMSDKKFLNETIHVNAVHYLQYVVTGLSKTDEIHLPLNKILCGLPLSHPVPGSIDISDEHKKLIDGLINAAIGYWPAIGETSIAGFRGNWLVRDGLLIEQEEKWELIVEKRAYDLLIDKSPFSFSIIKYMWMDKPLHVTWPY